MYTVLVSLNPTIQPNPSLVVPDEGDAFVPVTMNAWKPSWKRKESTMMMSEVNVQKPVWKKTKHQQSPLESLEPCSVKYRGTACASLKHFLPVTKRVGLCTSLLASLFLSQLIETMSFLWWSLTPSKCETRALGGVYVEILQQNVWL